MKTGIIKKSDFIHIRRQKLSNVLLSVIGKTLLFLNFITFKKFQDHFVVFFNWTADKSIQFYFKN